MLENLEVISTATTRGKTSTEERHLKIRSLVSSFEKSKMKCSE